MKLDNHRILDSLSKLRPTFKEAVLNHQNFTTNKNIKIPYNQEYFILTELPIEKHTWNEGDELSVKLTSSGQPMILAVSVGNNRKVKFYESYILHNTDSLASAEFTVLLPEITGKMEKLKVYLWNKDGNEAYIQQFEVKLLKL
jgi:hypothetical protein